MNLLQKRFWNRVLAGICALTIVAGTMGGDAYLASHLGIAKDAVTFYRSSICLAVVIACSVGILSIAKSLRS